ncbi:50S ribosomal protein L25 [Devosia yakushimensis]|uniref:Large ribosomal subunit protein bL25 n=1 Tax=Devosia yakushimensis TaxID=470028 RepID=A0ABQ5U9P7_9HYPH|nr:50S ribosomal protein L25/general stress protein Ctc [Devosia yakushimensis]GLQ08594.1 50S ribosomal protein L25 [Devosia yakushimensis]
MAATKVLKAQAREGVGKGAARELRRQGLVPAVIYGDKKPPVTISIAYKDAMKSIYAGGFLSHVIELDVDGTKHQVIPRDYQLDPVKDFAMHVDFLRIGKGAKLNVQVHVNFINEELSPGLKRGGTLNIVHHTLDLTVDAANIPEEVVVDLTGLDIGDAVHISNIKLPAGATDHSHEADVTIATIVAPSALKSSEGGEAEASEGEEEPKAE